MASGLGVGLVGGAVAGTVLAPGVGTFYGAIAGLAIAVVPSVFGAAAILVGANPSRSKADYVRRVRAVTIGLGGASWVVGGSVARVIDGSSGPAIFTVAVPVGLMAATVALAWAARRLAALEPPRPARSGLVAWVVVVVAGGMIASAVGALGWSHLLTGEALQRNDAIGLRNRAGDAVGLDHWPATSRSTRTGEAEVAACGAGPISRAEQSSSFVGDPTARLDRVAEEFATDGWNVVRGTSFERTVRWMYAERDDRSVLVSHDVGVVSIRVEAVVGCPQGVPSGSTYPVHGHEGRVATSDRTGSTPPVLVPIGEEIPGREANPALVSAAMVPEARLRRDQDDCSSHDLPPTPFEPRRAEPGHDRIVVVVAHEVDDLRAAEDDWVVIRRSGAEVRPSCIRELRGDGVAYGIGLPSTILLAGPFQDPADPVDRIELRSALSTFDPTVAAGYDGSSIGHVAPIGAPPRPVLVVPQTLPTTVPGGTGPGCEDDAQVLWVIWDREVLLGVRRPDGSAGYRLAVAGSAEPIVQSFHRSGDVHEICVPTTAAVTSITYQQGTVAGLDRPVTIEVDDGAG